jgi:hypothetical protein
MPKQAKQFGYISQNPVAGEVKKELSYTIVIQIQSCITRSENISSWGVEPFMDAVETLERTMTALLTDTRTYTTLDQDSDETQSKTSFRRPKLKVIRDLDEKYTIVLKRASRDNNFNNPQFVEYLRAKMQYLVQLAIDRDIFGVRKEYVEEI